MPFCIYNENSHRSSNNNNHNSEKVQLYKEATSRTKNNLQRKTFAFIPISALTSTRPTTASATTTTNFFFSTWIYKSWNAKFWVELSWCFESIDVTDQSFVNYQRHLSNTILTFSLMFFSMLSLFTFSRFTSGCCSPCCWRRESNLKMFSFKA